jgi:hypothetical protein
VPPLLLLRVGSGWACPHVRAHPTHADAGKIVLYNPPWVSYGFNNQYRYVRLCVHMAAALTDVRAW